MSQIKLVAGLGNPGKRYEGTRHNIGFLVVDKFIARCLLKGSAGLSGRSGPSWRERDKAEVAESELDGQKVIFVKPLSFMNLSGEPLQTIAHFYKIALEEIAVVHDEIDLPLGTLRLKQGGGDGGHNGIKSIVQCFGGADFHRLRVGVGRPAQENGPPVADWVLGKFGAENAALLDQTLDKAADALLELMRSGLKTAQLKFN